MPLHKGFNVSTNHHRIQKRASTSSVPPRSLRSLRFALCGVLLTLGGCNGRIASAPAVDPVVFRPPAAVTLQGSQGALPAATLPARIAIAQIAYDCAPHEVASNARLKVVHTPPSVAVPLLKDFVADTREIRDVFLLDPAMMGAASFSDPSHLLAAAQRYGADIVLAFSTSYTSGQRQHVMPLSVLTLGFAPNVTADADAIGRVAILDARTGYVYQQFDVTAESWQLATSWNKDDAQEQASSEAQERVIRRVVEQARKQWPTVAAQLAGRQPLVHIQPPPAPGTITPPGLRYTTR